MLCMLLINTVERKLSNLIADSKKLAPRLSTVTVRTRRRELAMRHTQELGPVRQRNPPKWVIREKHSKFERDAALGPVNGPRTPDRAFKFEIVFEIRTSQSGNGDRFVSVRCVRSNRVENDTISRYKIAP